MKKNRPGTMLGVIGRPEQVSALAELILRETTTLGVRLRRSQRLIAERRQEQVTTPFGTVRVKLKLLGDRAVAAPEYDDCAQLARESGAPSRRLPGRAARRRRRTGRAPQALKATKQAPLPTLEEGPATTRSSQVARAISRPRQRRSGPRAPCPTGRSARTAESRQ